jgi:hypothetical protein
MLTARQGEELMALAGFYDGESTLMSVAEGLLKTVRSLLVVMRDKRQTKNNEE